MIAVSDLSKSYGRFGRRAQALSGVSLEVRRGETVGLIGPNGAGKTTLLSCLLGFLRPDRGTVTVGGLAPDDLAVRAMTGYMPERLGFDRDLTGAAFLSHHWRLAGGDPRDTAREVAAAAARVELPGEALLRRLSGYSRGMLQRIGVAQAMPRDPQLLLLDEPASGTDPLGVAIVRDRILEAKGRGATIMLNSHQLPEVERVCDRVVFLSGGRGTQSRALRGPDPAPRRASVRVPGDRADAAIAALARDGVAAHALPDGTLSFPISAEDDLARAVKALALADVPVLDARSSADLEGMFRTGGRA
jgi:ABC-type multidrug transport system ATPase subunit